MKLHRGLAAKLHFGGIDILPRQVEIFGFEVAERIGFIKRKPLERLFRIERPPLAEHDKRRIGQVEFDGALGQRSVLRRQVDILDSMTFQDIEFTAEILVRLPEGVLHEVEVSQQAVAIGNAALVVVGLRFGKHLARLVHRNVILALLDVVGDQASAPDEIVEITQLLRLAVRQAEIPHALRTFEDSLAVVPEIIIVEFEAQRNGLHLHPACFACACEERIAHLQPLGRTQAGSDIFVIEFQDTVGR